MKKLESTAKPAINLAMLRVAKLGIRYAVSKLPITAIKFAIMREGRRPTRSAMAPNVKVPTTDPIKNVDCASADFHSSLQSQPN